MMKLEVCMRCTAREGLGILNPKQRDGYICVVESWLEFQKSQLKLLGFGRQEKCFKIANVSTERKEICSQWKAAGSDAEGNNCGVALQCRPRIHPMPPQLLRRLLLHSLRLLEGVMSMHARPPVSTAQVRLRPPTTTTTEFARRKEESAGQIVLGTVWMRKKVSYPLPF